MYSLILKHFYFASVSFLETIIINKVFSQADQMLYLSQWFKNYTILFFPLFSGQCSFNPFPNKPAKTARSPKPTERP